MLRLKMRLALKSVNKQHLFGEHEVLSTRGDLLDCLALLRCCGLTLLHWLEA